MKRLVFKARNAFNIYVEIPKEVIETAERLGIDVTDVILNQLYLKDPTESIRLRLELARKYLNEAREYMNKGDAVQASEKAYKAAEEIVKALAEKYNTPENQQAIRRAGGIRTYCLRLVRGYPRPLVTGYWMVGMQVTHCMCGGVFMRLN